MTPPRVLVAGIGNIFHGDDAVGCHVAQALAGEAWPAGVAVADYGIRSYDLAYAILDGPEATVLVDAMPQGAAPGTVTLLQPDLAEIEAGGTVVNGHSLNPLLVLQLVRSLGGNVRRLYVVGVEPAVLEADDLVLSPAVEAAVPTAAAMVRTLVADLLAGRPPGSPSPCPAVRDGLSSTLS